MSYQEEPGRDYRKERDAAYTERNHLVAALCRLMVENGDQAWLSLHSPDPDWDPAWRTIVFISGPTGQMSWGAGDVASGFIPSVAIRASRNRVVNGAMRVRKYLVEAGAALYKRSKVLGTFPAWRDVVKEPPGESVSFGFSVRYLVDLAAAIGADDRMACVMLTVKVPAPGKSMLDPILVRTETGNGAFGILMPRGITELPWPVLAVSK